MKERILSMLLAFCLVLTLLPGTALAAGDDVAYPVTGGNIYFNKSSATITSSDYGITDVVIPSSIDGVEVHTIGTRAFAGRVSLRSIYIPRTVTAIPTDFGLNPFAGCHSLSNISVDPNNQYFCAVDGILYRYAGTGIDYKSSLELVVYPEKKGNAIPGTLEFQVPDNVVGFYYDAFKENYALKSITISKKVESIGEVNINVIGAQTESPFKTCYFLTAVNVDEDNKYYRSIDGILFNKQKTMLITYPRAKQGDTYAIPNGVTEIADSAFEYAEKLASISIPDGIKRIESSAFSGCKSLTSITIPASVTYLGSYVFTLDSRLKDIYYGGSEEQWQELYNQNNNEELKGVTVHYNSTGPDDPENPSDPDNPGEVEAPVSFSLTRNTVPYKGEITVTAVIPKGEDLTIGDVKWVSSDSNIIAIDPQNISYLDDTAIVTALAKGNAIGKAVIFVTSVPDGRTASITLEVVPDVSNFNPTLFRANSLQEDEEIYVKAINDSIGETTPGQKMIKNLQENGFQDAVASWEAFELISDSVDDITALWDFAAAPKDLYSAVILNALEASVAYDTVPDSFEDTLDDCSDFVSEISSLVKTKYGFDALDPQKFKNMTLKEKEGLAEETEEWFKKYQPDLHSLGKVFDGFTKALDVVGSVEDYLELIVSSCIVANTSESMKEVIRQAYQDSLSSGNLYLQLAYLDCIEIISSSTYELIDKLYTDELVVIGEGAAKYLIKGLLWEEVSKTLYASHPAVAVFQTAYKTGKYVSNLIFNTDDTIEQYLKMLATSDVESLFDTTYNGLKANYAKQRDVKSAEIYFSAIDLLFSLRDTDTVNAYKFVDILDETMINQIYKLFGKDTFSDLKSYLRLLQKNYYTTYESALFDWVPYLEEMYPNTGLFEYYNKKATEMIMKKEATKEFVAACPIDVYVYDESNELVASIVDGRVTCDADVTIGLIGDTKFVRFYEGQNYRIEYVGTDNGDMDVTINEFDSNGTILRTVNYYDITLTDSTRYSAEVDDNVLVEKPYKIREMTTGEDISSDYDSLLSGDAKYSASVWQGTMIYNGEGTLSTSLASGADVELYAYIPEGYHFVEWTASNGENIFEDRFSSSTKFIMPEEDIVIRAIIKAEESNATPVTDLSIDEANIELSIGDEITLSVSISPADASNTNIIWTSSDPSVATVNENGVVTAVSDGNAIITGSTIDGGYTDSCVVTVKYPSTVIPDDDYGGTNVGSETSFITSPTIPNGTLTVTPSAAQPGEKVTVTTVPDQGYITGEVTATDGSGKSVPVTDNGDGTYSFTMPEGGATVNATFLTPAQYFTDAPSTWYQDGLAYVVNKGLMKGTGTSPRTFGPNDNLTRGQLVTILYRLEKEPAAGSSPFTDVADGKYYDKAVAWAAANGIVKGETTTTFHPEGSITREQIAAILYRYAEYKKYDTKAQADLSGYTDAGKISGYAEAAMKWANAEGLITGRTATTLVPAGNATRAEIATILMRFCEDVAK